MSPPFIRSLNSDTSSIFNLDRERPVAIVIMPKDKSARAAQPGATEVDETQISQLLVEIKKLVLATSDIQVRLFRENNVANKNTSALQHYLFMTTASPSCESDSADAEQAVAILKSDKRSRILLTENSSDILNRPPFNKLPKYKIIKTAGLNP